MKKFVRRLKLRMPYQEQFANALSQSDKDEINDTLAWLDSNQDADVATIEAKQKELEGKLMPLMQAAYQHAAGSAGGAAPGGMPGGIDPSMFANMQGGAGPAPGAAPSGHSSGPRVEEVD